MGFSLSRHIWQRVVSIIPPSLIAGARGFCKKDLLKLGPFYSQMFRSYAITNNLFYEKNRTALLPQNLWAIVEHPKIPLNWCEQEFFTASDIPTKMGKVDYHRIAGLIPSSGMYLTCCSIQKYLGSFLNQ